MYGQFLFGQVPFGDSEYVVDFTLAWWEIVPFNSYIMPIVLIKSDVSVDKILGLQSNIKPIEQINSIVFTEAEEH